MNANYGSSTVLSGLTFFVNTAVPALLVSLDAIPAPVCIADYNGTQGGKLKSPK